MRYWRLQGAAMLILAGAAGGGHAIKAAEAEKTQPVSLTTVSGSVPAAWKAQQATSQFRVAQYDLPRAQGDTLPTQCIIFHFGKGGGGSVQDNVRRWEGMVRPGGKKNLPARTEQKEGLRLTLLDLSGTYMDRPFPASDRVTERPGYRMLAAIIETTDEGGDGPYFVRLVGPEKSVEAAKSGWDGFIRSLKTR